MITKKDIAAVAFIIVVVSIIVFMLKSEDLPANQNAVRHIQRMEQMNSVFETEMRK
jgi:hypothetical protein